MVGYRTLGKRTLLVTCCLMMVLSPFYMNGSIVNASAPGGPRYGGTLRIAYPSDPISWNPIVNYWSTSQYLHRQVYNKLATYDDLYNTHGDLLNSWSVSSEPGYPSVYTLELESNIRWHDGHPLTAEDVQFTYETLAWGAQNRADCPDPAINDRLQLPAYRSAYFADLKQIEILNAYTLKFYFSEVQLDNWLVEMSSTFNVLPKHLWEGFNKFNPPGATFEDNPYNTAPVGSGPFKLVEHALDQYVIMERNPDYFRGIPYLEHLVWVFNPDRIAAVLAFENGEVDTIHEAMNFPQTEVQRINEMPQFTVNVFPYTTTWRITFNLHPNAFTLWPWSADVRVRQALEYAIDKQTLVDNVLNGFTRPTYTALSWIVAPYGGDYNTPEYGYTGSWPIDKRTYNPDMANQLLDDAGWPIGPGGTRFSFQMPYYHYATEWAEAIAAYWEQIYIDCEPIPIEATTFFEEIEMSETGLMNPEVGGPYPLGLNTMGGGPDPDTINFWLVTRSEWGPGWATGQDNFGFYSNARVDELFIEGRQTGVYSERKEIYDELQWNVHEDVGYIFLWNNWKIKAWNNDFAGFGSNRPLAWYGSYFRGDDDSSNLERGVYWRGGTSTPPSVDTTPPEVAILSPLNTTYATTTIPVHAVNTTEAVDTAWWRYLNGTWDMNQTLTWNPGEARWEMEGLTWLNGSYQAQVFFNDSSGNEAAAIQWFSVDTTLPATLISPLNTTYTMSAIPVYAINTTAADQAWCRTWDGTWSTNTSLSWNGSEARWEVESLSWPDGHYQMQVFFNDSIGNKAFLQQGFTVDTPPPNVTIISPQNMTYGSIMIPVHAINTTGSISAAWWRYWNGSWSGTYPLTWNESNTRWESESMKWYHGNYMVQVFFDDGGLGAYGNATQYFAVDTIPPDTITDLTVNTPTTNSLTLTWTAPGDDETTGTATSYEVRFSTSGPIDDPQGTMQWNQLFGYNGDDTASGILETADGGFIIAGTTNYTGAGGNDMWLIKTDASGNHQWNQTYGGPGDEGANGLIQTADGGFILIGFTESYGAGDSDFWLVKTDAFGLHQWNQTYGGSDDEVALAIIEMRTGSSGYALAGYTESFGAGARDFWLVKIDSSGMHQWNETYGGSGSEDAYAIVETADGGFALGGPTSSFGTGSKDFWLVKTDAHGHYQWNQTYGGTESEIALALLQTTDGGYILGGSTRSFGIGMDDAWLVKTDSMGTVQWNQTYGTSVLDEVQALIETDDGGFALAGITGWPGATSGDFWLVKIDALGVVEWNQTYTLGENFERVQAVIQTLDGGFALVGNSQPVPVPEPNIWLVRTVPHPWNSATTYPQSWTPQSAEATETQMVTGLSASTTYWFAITALDDASNTGYFSNSPGGTTSSPPPPSDDDDDDDNGGGGGGGGDDDGGKKKKATEPPMDTDGDGLSDSEEITYGTDPQKVDTDGDGLSDHDELKLHKTDPTVIDTDQDGLSDYEEVQTYGTNSTSPDTDQDSLLDGAEIHRYFTDPLTPDGAVDSDGDGLTNVQEVDDYGTNPQVQDTDADGLSDGEEIKIYGCNPLKGDTDNDGLSDNAEIAEYGTNPLMEDTDGDTLFDGIEVNEYRTNPLARDSDGDGIPDPEEIAAGTDPLDFQDPQPVITTPEFSFELGVLVAFILVVFKKKLRDYF